MTSSLEPLPRLKRSQARKRFSIEQTFPYDKSISVDFTPPREGGEQRKPLDIPIIDSLYATFLIWNAILKKFPKAQRYALGQTCTQCLLVILEECLYSAQVTDKLEKTKHLQIASVKTDSLKVLVRLCKDSGCVTNEQYLQMESKLQETGRMQGGWMKSLR